MAGHAKQPTEKKKFCAFDNIQVSQTYWSRNSYRVHFGRKATEMIVCMDYVLNKVIPQMSQ